METSSLIYVDPRSKQTEKTRQFNPPSSLTMPHANGYQPAGTQSSENYTSKWDKNTEDEVEVDYSKPGDSYSYKQMNGCSKKKPCVVKGRRHLVLKCMIVCSIFALGAIVGFILRKSVDNNKSMNKYLLRYSPDISLKLRSNILAEEIKKNLKNYTSKVRMAGTASNNALGQLLASQMRSYKQLGITIETYNVLLSYADMTKPSFASIVQNGSVLYQTKYDPQHPHSQHPEFYPFVAYAPSGSAKGQLVYANFGEESDFKVLKKKGVPVRGNVVIMRTGGSIFFADKIENAAANGATGALIYTDPAQVHRMDTDKIKDVYPHTWYLPGWAVRRHTALRRRGDPLTPGAPSIPGIRRLPEAEAGLPRIPVHVISFDDAEQLMRNMTGQFSPSQFHGSLNSEVEYRFGPGYHDNTTWIEMEVNQLLEKRNVSNILGVIKGEMEPDRYVIVGSRYDAWTYGATESGGGTAIIQQLASAFGKLTQEGWRPSRTIILAHWDAGEHGFIGVSEWAQERGIDLKKNAVCYINLDAAVLGNYTLEAKSSPMLQKLIQDVTKTVESVDSARSNESLYQTWVERSPDPETTSKPWIQSIGAGENDAAPFVYDLGVPSAQLRTVYFPPHHHSQVTYAPPAQDSSFPASNTATDTFYLVSRFVDPTFRAHETLAKVVGELVLRMATSPRLPLEPSELVTSLQQGLNDVSHLWQKTGRGEISEQLRWKMGNLSTAVETFTLGDSAEVFTKPLKARQYNDKVMLLSRAFLADNGQEISLRQSSNIFLAPSPSSWKGNTFPGLRKALIDFTNSAPDAKTRRSRWKQVEQQTDLVLLALHRARLVLSDVTTDL